MRKTCLLALATGLLLSGHALAQTNAGVAVQATTPAVGAAANPNHWRYVQHNGQWWYYTPQNNWMRWNGSAWAPHAYSGYGGYGYANTPYTAGYRGVGGANGYYGNGYGANGYGNGYYGNGYGAGYGAGYGPNGAYGYGSQSANAGANIGGALGGQTGANVGAAIGGFRGGRGR